MLGVPAHSSMYLVLAGSAEDMPKAMHVKCVVSAFLACIDHPCFAAESVEGTGSVDTHFGFSVSILFSPIFLASWLEEGNKNASI